MRKKFTTIGALIMMTALAGCSTMNHHNDQSNAKQHAKMFKDVHEAVAVLHPTRGNNVYGVVNFVENGDGSVTVHATVRGLEPGSEHGIHIHQYGDCTAADGTSAGGHYNPENNPHGLPPAQNRHAGDLGNITANDQGIAHLNITVDNITVAGMKNPIIGRGMIVHAESDKGTQPTGDAGARLACGVIGVAKPEK